MNFTKHLIAVGTLCLLSATAMLPWRSLLLPTAQQLEVKSPFENEIELTEAWLATYEAPHPTEISPQAFMFGAWEPKTNLNLSNLSPPDDFPLPENEPGDVAWTKSGLLKLMPPSPSTIVFCTDEGSISLNLRTGDVEMASGTKLPKAAVAFWKAVARAFPEARQIIIREEDQLGGPLYHPSLRYSGSN